MLSLSETRDFPSSSASKESTCNVEDPGLNPGLGRSPGEGIIYPLQYSWALLMTQMVKNAAGFDPWVGKIPWRRARQPTQVFLPGESPWTESLAAYSPWNHKEWDMTVTKHTYTLTIDEGLGKVTCWWLWQYRKKEQHHFHEDML